MSHEAKARELIDLLGYKKAVKLCKETKKMQMVWSHIYIKWDSIERFIKKINEKK